jgi:dTMP kinase
MMATRIEPARIQSVFEKGATHPGRLITVVGFDGSGKTTQIQALGRRFRAAGHEVVETRQPSDWYRNETAVQLFHDQGGSIQRARILALFAAADRLRHVQQVIVPALQRGAVVLCDRYVYATFGVFVHRGVDVDFLATINSGIPRPDFAFYLHLPTAALMQRLRRRDGIDLKFEERSVDRIASITRVYDDMGDLLIRIDGTAAAEAVTDAMWTLCGAAPATVKRA